MPTLSDTQAAFRSAVAGHPAASLLTQLRAPVDPRLRLDIYRRHHRESFRRHLRGRFPTLEWLLGTDRLVVLADATLERAPPRAPSLAEYGHELIATLASAPDLPPYIADVARLDWHLGGLSVAVDHQPLGIGALTAVVPDRLPSLSFTLQPGLAYLASDWPVDDLVHLRHRGDAPEQLTFLPQSTQLELRGARGRFTLRRLEPGTFAFRARLSEGAGLAAAAEQAAAAQASFDLPAGLASLFAEGLVIHHSGDSAHA
jgi:hypothetical protein